MRSLIFNQCRDLITGVMCENLEDLTTVRAREFSTPAVVDGRHPFLPHIFAQWPTSFEKRRLPLVMSQPLKETVGNRQSSTLRLTAKTIYLQLIILECAQHLPTQ